MPTRRDGEKKRRPSRKLAAWLNWLIDILPLAVPAALAAFSVVTVVFLLAGQLRGRYVWPLGLLAALATGVVVARKRQIEYPGVAKERTVCNILLILGVIVWVGFNALYTAQHVYTNRDPGTYTVASEWLIHHDNITISAPEVFGATAGISPDSAGFSLIDPQTNPHIAAQGLHLLPALMGLMGRIVGDVKMLHTQVIFGGTALLAMYGFARLLVRPRWALVATAAMALSLPLIYFSRDTYTEPLAMTFTFGALALLWEAQRRKSYSLWFVAGLIAGAGALTRIDAYLTVALLAAFLVVYLVVSPRENRAVRGLQAVWMLAGMAVTSVIGWLDLSRLSEQYYGSTWVQVKPELLLIALIIGVGAVAVAVFWKKTGFLSWLDKKTMDGRGWALAGLVVAAFLVLASRPFWDFTYSRATVVGSNGIAHAVLQRSYLEQATNWVVWYIGPVLAVLALLGIVVAAYRMMKPRGLLILPAFLVIVGTSLFYLHNPHVFADQMWGSRRLVPVILPGFAILGVLALEWLYGRGLIRKIGAEGRTLATIGATVGVLTPLFISMPFMFVRESAWLSPVKEVCKALPANAAVLWVGIARTQLVEPTEAYCNVPSEGYGALFKYDDGPSRITLAEAAKAARAAGYVPVVGTFVGSAGLVGGSGDLTTVTNYTYRWIEHSYTKPPRVTLTFQDAILLGRVGNDGSVIPLQQKSQ